MLKPSILFYKFHRICLNFLCCLPLYLAFAANAMDEREEYEITEIASILSVLPDCPVQSTLLVLDWDNTVTLKDGDDTKFREEGTLGYIKKFRDLGYDILILTSRFGGIALGNVIPGSKDLKTNVDAFNIYLGEMDHHLNILSGYQCLKSLVPDFNKVLLSLPIHEESVTNDSLQDHMILTHNVVFAGSHDKEKSNKGPALTKLLDLNIQGGQSTKEEDGPIFASNKQYDHIVFVDNDEDHITSMKQAFTGRYEKLITLFYPQD